MNQQPDKFFREKLETLGRPAPARAWSRIEQGLPKKNNNRLWLRIAATLLLAGAVAYLIWPAAAPDATHNALSHNSALHKDDGGPATENAAVPEKETAVTGQDPADVAPAPSKKTTPPAHASAPAERIAALAHNTPRNNNEAEHVTSLHTPVVDDVIAIQPEAAAVAVAEEPAADEKNFKLVIDADEANDKYLNKKSLAQATTEEQKSSGFKRLLHKAHDLKTNQNSFGELRQMKNEILALNFKENKKQEQNK